MQKIKAASELYIETEKKKREKAYLGNVPAPAHLLSSWAWIPRGAWQGHGAGLQEKDAKFKSKESKHEGEERRRRMAL